MTYGIIYRNTEYQNLKNLMVIAGNDPRSFYIHPIMGFRPAFAAGRLKSGMTYKGEWIF